MRVRVTIVTVEKALHILSVCLCLYLTLFIQHAIDARSRNHCYRGKSITYSEYVFVCLYLTLVIQHAKRMRRII